jgi:hypothetical protein
MALSPDIEEQILAALQQMFAAELQTALAGDRLALKTLKPLPLQDDPTLSAPYLVYGPDYELGTRLVKYGEEEKEYGCVEIGGPVRFLRFYTAICGTPVVTTREQCYADIASLSTRVLQILMQHYDLSNILVSGQLQSADQSTWIEGANPLLIDGCRSRLKGGEQTWFGEATITWHYPVSWYPFYLS